MSFTIAAYSVGDCSIASSRLRSFYLFHYAESRGVKIIRNAVLFEALSADLIHVQKCIRNPILYIVLFLARITSKKIIFDFDDQPRNYASLILHYLFFVVSSGVTVDTEIKRRFWQARLPWTRVYLIPDVVDINPDSDSVVENRQPFQLSWRKNFFWIGYSVNLSSIQYILNLFRHISDSKMTVIVESRSVRAVQKRFPWVSVMPWVAGIFENWLEPRGFLVLNHADTRESVYKSENKMVLAIATGFIPVVSPTYAYRTLAESLGAQFLVFDSFEEAVQIPSRLSESQINYVVGDCCIKVRSDFSSHAVFSLFYSEFIC